MKKIMLFILLTTLFIPLALADYDSGKDGFKLHSVKIIEEGLIPTSPEFLAIVTDRTTYEPGETVRTYLECLVPGNTRYVYLRVVDSSGSSVYFSDISDYFDTLTCSYIELRFTAPNTPSNYKIYADFKDGNNRLIYSDQGSFRVGTDLSCPDNYCTDWGNAQIIENGFIETKSCYDYTEINGQCQTSATNNYRLICNNGYVPNGDSVNSQCVRESGVAECGDGVVQSGEECDNGFNNGACPSTCNSFCSLTSCEDLPVDTPDDPDPTNNDQEIDYTLAIAIVLIVAAFVVLFRGKKK